MLLESNLTPLIKYPGGKSSELSVIEKYLPQNIGAYIEPFVGGGAVFFYLNNDHNFINDKSEELMLLYEYVKTNNRTFYKELNNIIDNWEKLHELSSDERISNLYKNYRDNQNIDMQDQLKQLINIDDVPMFNLRSNIKFEEFLVKCLTSKFLLLRKNEIKKNEQLSTESLKNNLEAGIKASYYTYLRDIYNNPKEYDNLSKPRKVAIYLFIREYCFSSMFRFNKNGGFNVPYGGVSYNKKTLETRRKYYKSAKLKQLLNRTELFQLDFYDFVNQIAINNDDFMFLDPPYDTTFSEYDKNSFNEHDQERLAQYLINQCPCRFMLVIKKTDYIASLYENKGLRIVEVNKKYLDIIRKYNKKLEENNK